ncbi:MAG TPA: hypothetical protein VL096_20125 [Pirellulaceae bacterium]|nr:hypothetical protein [Pirellulaceae bacterium]
MPATESTWRDQKKLHFLFAISGAILFIATIWMFLKDHNREWKVYQDTARNVQIQTDKWKEEAIQTVAYREEHEKLEHELMAARAESFDRNLLDQFEASVDANLLRRMREEDGAETPTDDAPKYDFSRIELEYKKLSGDPELAKNASADDQAVLATLKSDKLDDLAARVKAYAASSELTRIVGLAQVARDRRLYADKIAVSADETEKVAATDLIEKDSADRALIIAQPADVEKAKADVAAKTAKSDESKKAAAALRAQARSENDAALQAEIAAGKSRSALLEKLNAIMKQAKFIEDRLSGERKFQNANLDKAKADEGLGVRDSVSSEVMHKLEERIHEYDALVSKLTLRLQGATEHRKELQKLIKAMTAKEDEVEKRLDTSTAKLVQLEKAIVDKRSTYVVWWNGLPTPGKKLLEAPILSAFNSPLKIENLWSDGLVIDYNFRDVKRYDRCTTCHQLMEKSQPGLPNEPGYVKERSLTLILTPPTTEKLAELKKAAADAGKPLAVEDVYGLAIAGGGLIDRNAVSITNVLDSSLASQARLKYSDEATAPQTGDEIRDSLLMTSTADRELYALDDPNNPFSASSGLYVGDVFVDVDGNMVRSQGEAERFLLEGANAGKPLHIQVRRGLVGPYTSHPRLDLFVGGSSPHKLQEFACTICHDGQGSATDFKWASHTPNDVDQAKKWSDKYGWFDNHHWIYPMNPKRFAESSCLKCHHEVVDLEPSEKFTEPPAPQVVRGYNLIRKYGCYGCHEINGYDGPEKRIGPDLRLEPNVFAAAQQLQADPHFVDLTAEEKGWIETLVQHPERTVERERLLELLTSEKQADEQRLSPESLELAGLFKEGEAPGTLRKPGPSLRFADKKLDPAFIYDWIANPKNFRPSTRMPQVFGLDKHLENSPESLHITEAYEPIEILAISTFLQGRSQKFEYLEPPADVKEVASAERGKTQFQTRGCLACHSHGAFPEAEKYRDPHSIVQGPDLSNLAKKFDPARNPNGQKWLYSWIKEPTRYHVRTVMPNLFLDPIEATITDGAEERTALTDPVADIVAYLLTSPEGNDSNWQPVAAVDSVAKLDMDKASEEAMNGLLMEYLKDSFSTRSAEQFIKTGIPMSRAGELKGAEKELLVPEGESLGNAQKLAYLGRRTIGKYGCYGCHDIPGFEDAKPIGAGLNDWGRKEPAKLAFEHILEYLAHGHHGPGHGAAKEPAKAEKNPDEKSATEHASHGHATGEHPAEESPVPPYFMSQLNAGNRIGFLYQKLREPRSYDWMKTENKKYNERLRMPLFPFNDADREAVMTFVLGLVADPPEPKYLYKPDPRQHAIIEGQKVLEKFNCASCHILQADKWKLAFTPEHFGEQMSDEDRATVFPFLLAHVSPEQEAASNKVDRRGLEQATLSIMPRLSADGRPDLTDENGDPLEAEDPYDPTKVQVGFDLWNPAVLSGKSFLVGVSTQTIPATMIEKRQAAQGGFLTRYLLPVVTKLEGNGKGKEALGWLPPPLVGEGEKVQSAWLHEFLLEPYPIRPAVYLRMPKFNMSREEAVKLAAYFAAIDNVVYPYDFNERRQPSYLQSTQAGYASHLEQLAAAKPEKPLTGTRFDHAMNIVVSGNYCVKCHIVSDFAPTGEGGKPVSPRGLAPDLGKVYSRLRPDYLREWIAKPTSKLPYTSMPVNIKFNANGPFLGDKNDQQPEDGKPGLQDLYHGTSIEQIDGLVDLLMNFDQYTKEQTQIKALIPAAAPPAPAAETPASAE